MKEKEYYARPTKIIIFIFAKMLCYGEHNHGEDFGLDSHPAEIHWHFVEDEQATMAN